MAIQGDPLFDVDLTGAPLDNVAGIPIGDLVDVDLVVAVQSATNVTLGNRFPTPPSAFGFLTEVRDADGELPYAVGLGVVTPFIIGGALSPGGPYLEPTIGQIWPRTG